MKKDLGQIKACSGSDSDSSNSDTEGGFQHTCQCPQIEACGLCFPGKGSSEEGQHKIDIKKMALGRSRSPMAHAVMQ